LRSSWSYFSPYHLFYWDTIISKAEEDSFPGGHETFTMNLRRQVHKSLIQDQR